MIQNFNDIPARSQKLCQKKQADKKSNEKASVNNQNVIVLHLPFIKYAI